MLQVLASGLQAAMTLLSRALAGMLRACPESSLESFSTTARALVLKFLMLFHLETFARSHCSAAPVVNRFWQQVMDCPTALEGIVETLQACSDDTVNFGSAGITDRQTVGPVMMMHVQSLGPGNEDGRHFDGWPNFAGSEPLQQYAMDAFRAAAPASWPPRQQEAYGVQMGSFAEFLAAAVAAGKVSQARLRILLTHESILAPCRQLSRQQISQARLRRF